MQLKDMMNYYNQLSGLSERELLQILNDKVPSEYTDDEMFLAGFGDYVKYDGIVMTFKDKTYRERLKQRYG